MATPKPGKMHSPVEAQAAVDKGLKMKIKRTKTGTKHEIVKSGENGEKKRGGSSHTREKKHGEKGAGKETISAPPPKDKEPPPPHINNTSNHNIPPTPPPASNNDSSGAGGPAPPPLLPQVPQPPVLSEPPPPSLPPPSPSSSLAAPPAPPVPPSDKETADACVGTSIGTITEPDCLGPCEPGTSVTLEGIVWHETEGVLVVNVTWRGKTYIGTLLDCTKHEWAPPRFSDSPTAELDVRTPRRGAKRGRNSGTTVSNDLANFTETRSSVYSKLRNSNAAGAKGKRVPGSSSPTPFASPKSEVTPNKRKNKSEGEEPSSKRKPSTATLPQNSTSPVPPPVLLECPEPNCSKKYKDANGLKYHQSHAHGSPGEEENKEFDSSEEEDNSISIDLKKDESTDTSVPVDEADEPEDKQLLRLAFGSNMIPGSPTPLLPPTTTSSPSPPLIDPPSLSMSSQPPTLTKVLPFKVKPASALMEDKHSTLPTLPLSSPVSMPSNSNKTKKNKKSPAGSPHPSPLKAGGISESGVQDQSHTYSDISDDDAPLLESEVESKPTTADEMKGQSPQLQPFSIYPFYGQPPFLVPSVSDKAKETAPDKLEGKAAEKDKKEGEFHLQKMLSHNYYQDDFPVPGSYQFNMEGSYPGVLDDKKSDKPGPSHEPKRIPPSSISIPGASKLKTPDHSVPKDKHQNENHQILKESIEMKSQINSSYMFQRQQPQTPEEVRQFYLYPERKDGPSTKATPPPPQKSHPIPSPRQKDKSDDKKPRMEDKKEEGMKPTMETQGPPPPSQYAYIHPGYMQTPPYGALPYDPGHPVYRGMNPMLVSSYPNPPFLPTPLHRYAPEDLSQGQSGKALDLLQHHASQYYGHPSHKIHELQERAMKSPTPKPSPISTTISSPSPSVSNAPPVKSSSGNLGQPKGPQTDNKERSPPPQRHIHTHHHTHVGLGYPILAGQYPTPFGTEDIRIPGTKYVPPPPVVKKEP